MLRSVSRSRRRAVLVHSYNAKPVFSGSGPRAGARARKEKSPVSVYVRQGDRFPSPYHKRFGRPLGHLPNVCFRPKADISPSKVSRSAESSVETFGN